MDGGKELDIVGTMLLVRTSTFRAIKQEKEKAVLFMICLVTHGYNCTGHCVLFIHFYSVYITNTALIPTGLKIRSAMVNMVVT